MKADEWRDPVIPDDQETKAETQLQVVEVEPAVAEPVGREGRRSLMEQKAQKSMAEVEQGPTKV